MVLLGEEGTQISQFPLGSPEIMHFLKTLVKNDQNVTETSDHLNFHMARCRDCRQTLGQREPSIEGVSSTYLWSSLAPSKGIYRHSGSREDSG
jgi:hypothetical protein